MSVHLCVQHVGRDAERRAVPLQQPSLVLLARTPFTLD